MHNYKTECFTGSQDVTELPCWTLPSLHVEGGEGFERSLAGEELEATLRVLDPSHAEEPHQGVKAVHKKRTED